jgi:hypothetical protein
MNPSTDSYSLTLDIPFYTLIRQTHQDERLR